VTYSLQLPVETSLILQLLVEIMMVNDFNYDDVDDEDNVHPVVLPFDLYPSSILLIMQAFSFCTELVDDDVEHESDVSGEDCPCSDNTAVITHLEMKNLVIDIL